MRGLRTHALLGALWLLGACGGGVTAAQQDQLKQRLRDALAADVHDRAERDDHSRTLAEVADSGMLEGMSRDQIRAALGPGQACRAELCSKNGFSDGDWMYEIGVNAAADVKQLPVLIIGFDPRGRAARVWTLTTH